jgi:hypothetical protein
MTLQMVMQRRDRADVAAVDRLCAYLQTNTELWNMVCSQADQHTCDHAIQVISRMRGQRDELLAALEAVARISWRIEGYRADKGYVDLEDQVRAAIAKAQPDSQEQKP